MNFVKQCLIRYPLLTTLSLVLIGVAVMRLPVQFFSEIQVQHLDPLLGVLGRLIAALLFIGLMIKLSWATDAGISRSYVHWHRHWFIIICPMLAIGLMNFTGLHWETLQFSWLSFATLFSENIAVGIFEEVMMRGFAFYVLYRAWYHRPYGIFKAAIAQALIFGLLHLINLSDELQVDVIAQVIYATLLGIGFAGVVAYTRTIWTAVFAHSFINIIGSMNATLNPNYTQSATAISSYVIMITVIFILVALPGFWCLKKAQDNKIVGAIA